MEWMLMPLRRYADFAGRSRRKEYWMYALGLFIVYAVIFGLFFAVGGLANWEQGNGMGGLALVFGILIVILALGLIVPNLAVAIRRLHDQDRSGWWFLISLVPYIGGIIFLVFMCLPGTNGSNRFGRDPKAENLADVFS